MSLEVLAGGGAVLAKTGKKVSVAEATALLRCSIRFRTSFGAQAELLATKVNRPEVVESVGEPLTQLDTGTFQLPYGG